MNKKNRIVAVILSLVIIVAMIGPMQFVKADSLLVDRKADVVFVIDKTGSMGGEIASVKNNIAKFMKLIKEEGVDVRVSFVTYGDYYYYMKYPSSYAYERADYSIWYDSSDVESAIGCLNRISVKGGGDADETVIDGLGCAINKLTFRADAAKFAIVLTDAGYKLENEYGYDLETGDTDIITEMAAKNIHTSVITKTTHYSDYAKFITAPSVDSADDGGILADIDGDYSILLKDLAKKVVTVTESFVNEAPIKVKSSMIVLKQYDGYEYSYALYDSSKAKDAQEYSVSQDSSVFKKLEGAHTYIFRYKPKGAGVDKYKYIIQTTETSTGARFSEIPAVLNEGEIYNIKVDGVMRDMVITSGASIHWSCASDCVRVTDDEVGYGCQVVIDDCEYNRDQLLKLTLVADVTYSVKNSSGGYTFKSKSFKRNFKIKNEIDAIDMGEFHGTTENYYKDGVIILTTKDKVSFDVIFNQGLREDTPSLQKLTYMISDQYGFKSSTGTKIAKVDTKGRLQGVNPGVTYLTVGPKSEYNKYGNCFNYSMTIPVLCPGVETVEFNTKYPASVYATPEPSSSLRPTATPTTSTPASVEAKYLELIPDGTTFDYSRDTSVTTYVVERAKGSSLNLNDYLVYNSTEIFNLAKMKKQWTTSDSSVASITKSGVVKFRAEGYVTITFSPTGGFEYDALTGKRKAVSKPITLTFKVVE